MMYRDSYSPHKVIGPGPKIPKNGRAKNHPQKGPPNRQGSVTQFDLWLSNFEFGPLCGLYPHSVLAEIAGMSSTFIDWPRDAVVLTGNSRVIGCYGQL